jgi:hypothetical protein
MVGSMPHLDTTDPVRLDTVHAAAETLWEPPLADTATEGLPAVLVGGMGEHPPPDCRPVGGASAVWNG